MLDFLLIKKALVSATFRKLLDFIPLFRAEDPQSIKKAYHLDVVAKLDQKYHKPLPVHENPRRTKAATLYANELLDHARWYTYRAQVLWGRESARDRYKSAWLYVTAATLFEHAGAKRQASDAFHFAANGFREVEAFRASIDYYIKASELSDDDEWVLRCLYRALGGARLAGDLDREAKIPQRVKELEGARQKAAG